MKIRKKSFSVELQGDFFTSILSRFIGTYVLANKIFRQIFLINISIRSLYYVHNEAKQFFPCFRWELLPGIP